VIFVAQIILKKNKLRATIERLPIWVKVAVSITAGIAIGCVIAEVLYYTIV